MNTSSTERFFRGFSLEDYRLHVLVNSLEKEKKQCLNRLREESHVFKMSIRPPVKCQEEYWNQYGEIFHANGDKRETGSITQINKEDVHDTDTAHLHTTTTTLPKPSNRQIHIPSSSQNYSGMNQAVKKCYQQRNRTKGTRNKDSKQKTELPGLTLLEILCADFEYGILLAKRTGTHRESGLKYSLSNLGRELSTKTHTTGVDKEPFPTDSDKKLTEVASEGSSAQPCTSKRSFEVVQSEYGESVGNSNNDISKSKSDSLGLNSNYLPHESSISELDIRSQETVALQDGTAQKPNWTSENSSSNCELQKIAKSLQSTDSKYHEGRYSKRVERKTPETLSDHTASLDTARKNEKSIISDHLRLAENGKEAQLPENSRFVHFKEGHKPSKRKSKKGNCVDNGMEKLNRTRSSGVKLYQVDGLQSSQKRKSQEEIDKETRQKMDQFFAKVEHTKSFQTSRPRWRCISGVDSNARRIERSTFLDPVKRSRGGKKEHGYRRAQPWPTQVWS